MMENRRHEIKAIREIIPVMYNRSEYGGFTFHTCITIAMLCEIKKTMAT